MGHILNKKNPISGIDNKTSCFEKFKLVKACILRVLSS